jgi:hypothetical protein
MARSLQGSTQPDFVRDLSANAAFGSVYFRNTLTHVEKQLFFLHG